MAFLPKDQIIMDNPLEDEWLEQAREIFPQEQNRRDETQDQDQYHRLEEATGQGEVIDHNFEEMNNFEGKPFQRSREYTDNETYVNGPKRANSTPRHEDVIYLMINESSIGNTIPETLGQCQLDSSAEVPERKQTT